MKTDDYIGQSVGKELPRRVIKAGRPRAIPVALEPVVIALYHQAYGYRAIANILREEYHINPHYSSVRQSLKRLGLSSMLIAVG